MAEDISKLTRTQTSVRVAAKHQIVGMLGEALKKERKELAELEKRPHDAKQPMPKEEGILDYKKLNVNTLHDRKRVLSKHLARANGTVNELKIKIVAIDNIIIQKIKNS